MKALIKAQEKLRTVKNLDVRVLEANTWMEPRPTCRFNGLNEGLSFFPSHQNLKLTLAFGGTLGTPMKVEAQYILEHLMTDAPNYIDQELGIDDKLDSFSAEDRTTMRLGYILFKTYQSAITGKINLTKSITGITVTYDSNWRDPELKLD